MEISGSIVSTSFILNIINEVHMGLYETFAKQIRLDIVVCLFIIINRSTEENYTTFVNITNIRKKSITTVINKIVHKTVNFNSSNFTGSRRKYLHQLPGGLNISQICREIDVIVTAGL